MNPEREVIILRDSVGTEVHIILPADLKSVGQTLTALGKLGYKVPDAVGAKCVTIEVEL